MKIEVALQQFCIYAIPFCGYQFTSYVQNNIKRRSAGILWLGKANIFQRWLLQSFKLV